MRAAVNRTGVEASDLSRMISGDCEQTVGTWDKRCFRYCCIHTPLIEVNAIRLRACKAGRPAITHETGGECV